MTLLDSSAFEGSSQDFLFLCKESAAPNIPEVFWTNRRTLGKQDSVSKVRIKVVPTQQ